MESINLPEIGQVVIVRQRRYIVTDVKKNPLEFDDPTMPGDTLVSLRSIEDDAADETLQVIWEIEPDARISEKSGLPAGDGMDDPKRFNAFLNAVRWGAISSADDKILNAPFRSGITIENYQLEPLVRAIQMPRVNLLIADDVGLGKTIEAGLVIQEMLLRSRVRTILIVCPSALQVQWKDQMRDKFGLDFHIVNSQTVKDLRRNRGLHVNPWAHFPRLITSIDFLKRDRSMSYFKKRLPKDDESRYPRKFDFMIVDEAHNIAPSAGGKYAVASLRTKAIQTLTPHFEHKLFLTATPHNGYKESFTTLLELLDNQRFARGIDPDKRQLERVMIRRMKSDILNPITGKPRFPGRFVKTIEVPYTDEEKQAHKWLQEYISLLLKNAQGDYERTAAEFMSKILKKRLFSSPAAFHITLEKHIQTLEKTRKAKPERKPVFGILRQQLMEAEDEDSNYENEDEETAEDVATRLFHELSPRERDLLNSLKKWAERNQAIPDSKQKELVKWLKNTIRPDGKWNDERVIIFTEYQATQNALFNLLSREKFTGNDRVMMLNGGTNDDERERIKAAFQADPKVSPVRILLATDAASEGIDLQNYCYRMIHMEIPWNPNRLEQRNGRLDRHGQTHDVLTFHFVPKGFNENQNGLPGTGAGTLEDDMEFLFRAVRKLNRIQEDIGKVGPVISTEVQKAMLGLGGDLNAPGTRRQDTTVETWLMEQRQRERSRERALKEREMQLNETRQSLKISPENTLSIVQTALALDGQPQLTETHIDGVPYQVYNMPDLTGSWAVCAEGLEHPFTHERRPITFNTEDYNGEDSVVLAHLNHRLVQKSMQLLRAEIWAPAGRKQLDRVSACVVSNSLLTEPALIAFARIVVTGASHQRIYEEIITAGGSIDNGRFNRFNVGDTNKTTALITDVPVDQGTKQALLEFYRQHQPQILSALEARAKERLYGIESTLAKRSQREKDDIEQVLKELEHSIEARLKESEAGSIYQLDLFSNDEREQLRKNIDYLQRRLQEIPLEIEEEKKRIEQRYSEPDIRTFPAAVMFLVPQKMIRK